MGSLFRWALPLTFAAFLGYAYINPADLPPREPALPTQGERERVAACIRAMKSVDGAPILTYADKAAFEARFARDCEGVTPELMREVLQNSR